MQYDRLSGMLVMAGERWATAARIYAGGQKHGSGGGNGRMETWRNCCADVARQGESRRAIQLTTVKYQTRTQNRIVLGTSREHMLEFA